MKHLLLTVALWLSLTTSYSQTFQWVKQLGGTNAEAGKGICTDASGNVLSAGFFRGTIDANPGAATSNLVAIGTGNSGYISKLDSNGNYIWGLALLARQAAGVCEIYGITSDATGNVYVTGVANDTVDFDPGAGTSLLIGSPSSVFIAKYSSAGALVWAKAVNGVTSAYGFALCVDGSGNVIATGRFVGNNIDFNPGAASNLFSSTNSVPDIFVLKLDASGNYVWAMRLGANNSDQAHSIKADAAGNIYLAGYFSATVDFDNGAGNANLASFGGPDGFVAKYTSAGGFAWVKQFGGVGTDVTYGMVMDASSNIYIAGTFQSTMDVDPDAGTSNLVSAGAEDIYIAKLNSSGALVWGKRVGGTGVDLSTGISIDGAGNSFTVGHFEGTVDFDPGAGTSSKTSLGLKDAYVLSLNTSGNFNWVKQIGSTTDDYASGVAATSANIASVYTTGSFTGTANFNSPGTANLTSIGLADAYIHRLYNACIAPTTPTINATTNSVCSGSPTTLSIATGNLNGAANWQWYSAGCGTTSAGSGTSITVNPTANTTYSVRGEGGCVTPGICGTKTITTTPTVTPTILVAASQTNICPGASVTFTSTITNGGTTPTYQWKKNGTNITGATSSTYTTSTLVNNDQISCVLTTSAVCASVPTANSTIITITVSGAVVPTISISANQTLLCTGDNVTFTSTITNGGSAPTYQWKLNGVNISGATSATYSTTSLVNPTQTITCVLTSNAACASTTTATSNGVVVNVNPVVTPTIVIATSTTTVCAGTNVTFSSTITNAGAPVYQWKKNGVNISGAQSSTYSAANLANNDQITCALTSNNVCVSPSTVISNTITMTVNPAVIPTISISTPSTTTCSGNTVNFTSTISNGGNSPTYQWMVNGINQGGATSSTYSTSTLLNVSSVTVQMHSTALCATNANVVSNAISMTVIPYSTPAVSIAATQNTICSGNSVTFTATPTNGGTTPSYQWKLNGNNVTATGATYTNASLANGDVVNCILTSSATCTTAPTATSNSITIAVSSTVVPAITISVPQTTVCSGANTTFTASPTNGGASPSYQWKKNGNNISGATSATYTTSSILTADVFSCVLTSSVSCAVPQSATSNTLNMTVTPTVNASVSITANPLSFCSGDNFTANAVPVNGGTSPAYQWRLNGSFVPGATSSSWSTTGLSDNDQVSVEMTSNASCAVPSVAVSAAVAVAVTTPLTVSVSVSASQTAICSGTNVTFTATVNNGGTAPVYQWKVNGNIISGVSSNTYSSSTLNNNDVVNCSLTSSETCVVNSTASSNGVTINIVTNAVASVSVSASASTICNGDEVLFTALPVEGGSLPTYQWKKNGTDISGVVSATYTTSQLQNSDAISVEMTSNSTCVSQPVVLSSPVQITVNVLPDVTITATGNTLSVVASDSYQWLNCVGNTLISGANSQSYTAIANGDYAVVVANQQGCMDTSACQNVNTVGIENIVQNSLRVSPNPFFDKIIVDFVLHRSSNETVIEIYNTVGELVKREIISSNQHALQLAECSSGMYMLQVRDGEKVYRKKVVKQ
jgi:hypothetical protein